MKICTLFCKEKYLGKNQLAEKNEYYSVCMRHSNGIHLLPPAKEFTFSGEDVFLKWMWLWYNNDMIRMQYSSHHMLSLMKSS